MADRNAPGEPGNGAGPDELGSAEARRRCRRCGHEFTDQLDRLRHECLPAEEAATASRRRYPGAQPPRPVWSDSPLTALFKLICRTLYTHNPFYLISACLILAGLNATFRASAETANAWTLMGVLAGYTAVMALAGFVIVRAGKVWEDGRGILLVVVLLFLATSVSFDEIINREAAAGRGSAGIWLLCCGFAFAVVLSEGLLDGLRIRLPLLFRLPYYAILALFFGYPILLRALLTRAPDFVLLMAIFCFPTVAGLAFLLVMPAVRRGAEYVRDNGTPWRWPWFPWLLFGVLALAVCVRSYYLTLSFHGEPGLEWIQRAATPFRMDTIFGLYFLVPFALSMAIILFEMGIVTPKRWLRYVALAIPLLALLMSFQGTPPDETYRAFLEKFTTTFCSPVFLTAVGAAVFYAYAWMRGARLAAHGLTAALLLCSIIGPRTLTVRTLAAPQGLPLLLLGLMQLSLALRRRKSVPAFLGAAFIIGACTTWFSGTWFTSAYGAIPVHLLYLSMLLIAALFRDPAARVLQHVGAIASVVLLGTALLFRGHLAELTAEPAAWAYIVLATAMPFVYGWLVRNITCLYVGLVDVGLSGLYLTGVLYHHLHTGLGTRSVAPFFWSALAFLLALTISLTKFRGVLRRMAAGIAHAYGTDLEKG